jgi:acetylornithine/N-succinyldiaminopimelate aminotransferase
LTQGLESLRDRHPDLVLEMRGKGLLRGVKLSIDNKGVQTSLRERKVLVGVAGENVVRFAPPLIVGEAEISQAIETLDAVLSAHITEAGA